MIKSARDRTVYSLETKNQSERNAVKSPQLYANSHTQSIKQNHPNPGKPHSITRCEHLLLRQPEFLASNLARDRKGQIFNHRCIICRWGKGTGVTLESSTRALSHEGTFTQLRVVEFEHKLLLQLHLNVRHHCVAASCHGGRRRLGLGERNGVCTRKIEDFLFQRGQIRRTT